MPKQYMVELAQDERDELEAVLKSSTRRAVSATKLQRARILLAVDQGVAGPALTDMQVVDASCVKNLLQFLVGAETRPYGRVSARREIFGRFMPPPAMSRIPVRMREPRRSGHIDNAAPSVTAHGSPPQVPRSDADRTPRSGRS